MLKPGTSALFMIIEKAHAGPRGCRAQPVRRHGSEELALQGRRGAAARGAARQGARADLNVDTAAPIRVEPFEPREHRAPCRRRRGSLVSSP
jgi:hypothetical protein